MSNENRLKFEPEHFGLAANDPAALAAWYQKTLDAWVIWSNAETPPAFLLKLGQEFVLEIYPANNTAAGRSDNKCSGWRHLALRVSSIETAAAQLKAKGVGLSEPIKPAGGGGRVLFFQDPEGNLLHLVERLTPPLFAISAQI